MIQASIVEELMTAKKKSKNKKHHEVPPTATEILNLKNAKWAAMDDKEKKKWVSSTAC